MGNLLANVVIAPLSQQFTYSIPVELAATLAFGDRVAAPFIHFDRLERAAQGHERAVEQLRAAAQVQHRHAVRAQLPLEP